MNENEQNPHTSSNTDPQTSPPKEAETTTQNVVHTSVPYVPPTEPTVGHIPFQTPPLHPRSNLPPIAEPAPNAYCNGREPVLFETEITEPIPLPRPKPSEDHNAFRDEPSAMSEAVRKKHFFLKGPRPLTGETPYAYNSRMLHETRLLHEENKAGLKASATKVSLLLILYIVLYHVFTNTVPIIATRLGIIDSSDQFQYTVLLVCLYLLIYPITFSIVIYLGNLGETHRVRTFLRKPQCSPTYTLKWFIIVTGCSYVINIVFSLISEVIGYDNGMAAEPFASVFDGVSQLVILCVFAPIFEEILFRGVILSHQLKYGAWHACLVSAMCFAFFHMNITQFFYTFFGGILMAMVVLKTGSLIPSMIIHALLNFISYLQLLSISLIDNYDEYINGADLLPNGHPAALALFAFTTLLPLIIMISAVILLVVELVTNKTAFKMPKGDSGLTTKEKASVFFSTPAVWGAIVITILSIVLREVIMYIK